MPKKVSKKPTRTLGADSLLGTGSVLLNLACSGKTFGGFPKGSYTLIVGDSSAGKTWISLTCLAEAMRSPHFTNHRLIYDNGEDGALMDIEKYFGSKVAERLEAPAYSGSDPKPSETVEDFYYNLDNAMTEEASSGSPFIYILDSENSLTSASELKKFKSKKKAAEASEETAGSYGDGKAKAHSENLRRAVNRLAKTESVLLILSQTRDNIGFGFEKKTRSGGRALKFYAALELWLSVGGLLSKTVLGKSRQIGIKCKVKVKKNRITGRQTEVEVPIYYSHGIDDVGSMVDYLLSEGYWKKAGKKGIKAPEFEFEGPQEKLIRMIESEELETDLEGVVSEVWKTIEGRCAVNRKQRYE